MIFLVRHNYLWALSFFLLCLWPVSGKSSTDYTGDLILGYWLFPAKGSSVELYKSGDRYFGRIADVAPMGKQQFGITKNQLLMCDLEFDGEGWSGGKLIHPKTGNRFDVALKMVDSKTIHVTVYKGFRWIGKDFVLTRKQI
jgi:uncharacterized protein (DUF2147 family)